MLGGIRIDLLVTVTLLFLTQPGTQCRADDLSLVTLPDWKANSDYVTQCFYDRQHNLICDWTRNQLSVPAREDVVMNMLESGPLGLEGKACLEFWYLAPVAAKGSELRVLLRSSTGLVELWTSPALQRDSWRQVFVPLTIVEPGTQVVLEATSAVSIGGQVAFDRIGVRRGLCGQQCEFYTELWTDESTRCLCSVGQLSCSPSLCPEGQICGPQRGRASEISTSGTCTIHSHTDCSTFDGVLFRFMAPCTYTLAKTCSSNEVLPVFSVQVVNGANGNSSMPTVQQIDVEMENIRVSLLERQTHRVVVNGVWRKLPLVLSNGTVNIRGNPAAVTLETTFSLSVSFDNAGAVHVNLPPTYSDHVCGLCGNFNHLKQDDFRKPDGTDAEDATALAESWQTGQTTSSCETILVPHQCDPLEEAEYASELYCGSLLSSTGPFAECQSLLGAESYYRGCVVGMCSTHGDPVALCEILQTYADICQEAGVAIPIWRNSTFCPYQCGENSHYNSCADGCPEVCSGLDIAGSCGSCVERCECDTGFKLSGGKCVLARDCGCWFNGKHYERGETWLQGECVGQCHCMGNNVVQCTAMQCKDNEVCKVKDGVKGCFPLNAATCSVYGDPHFITFDGMAYNFQGGCSYMLATVCGEESSVQFTVIGHNMHPPLYNFARSKLEAVALQIEDLYLTLNQSREVYVNTVHVQLPYSNEGAYGSVWVYMKDNYVVLETTFGLRMIIDGQNRLFLQVDERYKYELCGLCGTYSGEQDDDFITPSGQNATGPFDFGDSWRVPDNNECITHPNDPKVCDQDEGNDAYKECYALLRDAFKPCHELIHPSIYINSCVYDYCATSGDQHTLCESLKSYAAACQVAGVELPYWQTDTACAEPPTTASPPTTPTPTSPTPDQTFCPMNCNFDKNLCGWEQLIQDSFDWTRNSGSTPSNLTGPNHDHTSGAGFYMFIEGNGVIHGDSARLLSSVCHYNGPLCLHFWYHMHGSATAMALNIYLLKDNKATKLWSIKNNQGPEWLPAYIDIRVLGPFQIIVEGIRGSNAQSDVAIDDISINVGSCSGSFPGLVSGTELPSTTAVILPLHPVCNIGCSFDSNLCSWNQMTTDAFDWTWQSGSTPTLMTGPSADHTGDGHYLYIEASNVTYGDTARLISSECADSGPQCLQFWYHMYGSADTMGLNVYLLQNKLANAIWWRRNDQGNTWQLAQVDFTTTGAFQIIIEGRRGSSEESDVAIDDVKLYRGRCGAPSGAVTSPPNPDGNTATPSSVPVPTTADPEPPLVNTTVQLPVTTHPPVATTNGTHNGKVTEAPHNRPSPHPVCQLHCNFEQDLCEWSQILADVFDWTRLNGSTPTMRTGPSSDHTTGDGHYLYIEGNSATYGDTARLISSECSESGPQCLQFWYHMYGSADTMGLNVYLIQDRKANAVWWKRNDQGNMWHLAQVDFTTTGAFQIIFEGRRGSNDMSDVAIDDVSLLPGYCTERPQTTARPEQPATSTNEPQSPTTAQPQPPTTAQPQPPTTAQPQPPTTAQPQPPTTAQPQPPTTASPQPPTTAQPQPPTTASPQPPTTAQPQPPTTAQPQPPTTASPQPPTTASPQPPTTASPQPPTTAQPQPPTTAQPQPPTTAQPQPPTTASPQPPTTAQPQPPTTAQPQPPTTAQPQPPTTASPQPPTTASPQPPTTAQPQPPTTASPQPPTTAQPQPPTTAQPQPPTTASPQPPTTASPQPPTTASPQPPTTAQPQPPTTAQPQPPTTAQPQPPTTASPQPPTTAQPQPPTTAQPQPPTTAQPQPPTTAQPQPPTTAQPQPPTTAQPQPPTTAQPQPPTTAQPQPPTTASPQPPTTASPQPPTTAQPQPPTTASPQPPTTAQPQPPTTAQPQPPTTASPQPPTTASPQPPTTASPQPPTTASPQPPTTAQPQPPTTAQPQPPTTAQPQPPTTASPQPPTTAQPQPPTTAQPQPPTTAQPQPPTTASPQPPTTAQPQPPTTASPQPPTTAEPQPPTTASPQPPTTAQPQPPTTASPQPPTTAQPQPPTTASPQPPTTAQPQPPTTASPQPPTTASPQPPTTASPQPPTTASPRPPTTAQPQPPTTASPQPPTTASPQPPTTAQSQPPTTAQPQPPTTASPQPPTTASPQPPTTAQPQPPTTAQPQPPTTAQPQPPTTASPQPPTTAQPQPPTTAQAQLPTTASPQPPTTAQPQPPTTATPQPPTTAQPQPPTTASPQPPTTAEPQPPTTASPQPPTTAQPQPPTTASPQPPTTAEPQPQTTASPQPPTTAQSQPPTTAQPQPPTTASPQPPTTASPQPPTTAQPQPPTTASPQPPTTAQPQPPTTASPQPPTTAQPQPPTTASPQPPTTAQPQPPTTASPQPPTTASPQPPTTAESQPPTTASPQPPTTAQPQPPTANPQPPTTAQPQPPTTTSPQPPTTAQPQPSTTASPQPPTTAQPQPPTTASTQPPTTAKPQPPTASPQPPTTAQPQPPTTASPQPPTTAKPQPPTTASPQPPTTAQTQSPTTAQPQPSTTPVSTPSCPQNSHYTACIPACSPTCTHPNGPPHCSDNGHCMQGCVCDEGFAQKDRACVPIRQCGCVDMNGTVHQFNEVWYTNHCSQRCECKKYRGLGKIDCDDKYECHGNAVCLQNEEGDYYCQSTGFDECTIKRDSEYRTFDQKKYEFDGEHSYVLVQTRNLPNNLPDVYIEGINKNIHDDDDDDDDDEDDSQDHGDSSSEEDHSRRVRDEDDDDDCDDEDEHDDDDDDDSEEYEDLHRLQELKIRVYSHTVEFKKKRKLVVDGRKTKSPVSPTPGLNIYKRCSSIYLKTDFGLFVEFNGHGKAEIVLPRIYRRKVQGLCGNFDSRKQNDWTKPDGTKAGSAEEFAESWRV